MTGIEGYRARAASDRAAAEQATLPHRRAQLEASAERWEEMVREAAETASRAVINNAAAAEARVGRERQGIFMGRRPQGDVVSVEADADLVRLAPA